MPKVKRIFKYPTGAVVPDRAEYMGTVTQTEVVVETEKVYKKVPTWLVWHYFLVEVEQEQSE